MNKILSKRKSLLMKLFEKNENDRSMVLLLLIENLFLGALIPLQVISTGMNQFIIAKNSPLRIIPVSTIIYLLIGFIIFIIYKIACKDEKKPVFVKVFIGIVIWTILNYFIFGARFEIINPLLVYEGNKPVYSIKDYLITIVMLFLAIFIPKVLFKYEKIVKDILFVIMISILAFSAMKYYNISVKITPYLNSAEKSTLLSQDEVKPIYNFSKNKKNVVVVMLDRYVGKYFERVIANYPELKEQFSGFTFYPNTISFGAQTTTGSPGLFGGYDYIPVESDKRDTENIVDKHNEALTTMPILFGENNYDVVLSNLPDVNYWDSSRPNPFRGLKNVRVASYKGRVYDESLDQGEINSVKYQTLHFIQYPFMMFMPIMFRDFIYNDGRYMLSLNSYGVNYVFLLSKIDLKIMNKKTTAKNTKRNQFIIFNNTATHEPHYLSYPDFDLTYDIKNIADSSKIKIYSDDENVTEVYSDDEGNEKVLNWKEELYDYAYYDTCVMVTKEVGKWLDYLKELEVYDNSRIIIVSDHGTPNYAWQRVFDVKQDPEAKYYSSNIAPFSTLQYNPLLLFKDFNDTEFKVSNDFMTNADTVYLASKDLIDNPVNPHTKNVISDEYKHNDKLYVAYTMWPWEPTFHWNETRHETISRLFLSVKTKNMWDVFNWDAISGFKRPICDVHKNIVLRAKTREDEKERCGKKNNIDYYECLYCGTIFYDKDGKEVIDDKNIAMSMMPHKFTNYVRNMDEDEVKHGTMTALCDYGCGAEKSIGDPDALYHHDENKIMMHGNASPTEDGYDRSECSICGKVLDSEYHVIPRIDGADLEYYNIAYDGKAKTPRVVVKDRVGDEIDKKYYKLKYENNRNVGVADVNITFKKPYEGDKKEYFNITPERLNVVEAKKKGDAVEIEVKQVKKKSDGYEIEVSNTKDFIDAKTYEGHIRKRQFITSEDIESNYKYYRVRSYNNVMLYQDIVDDSIDISVKEAIENGKIYSEWVEFEVN